MQYQQPTDIDDMGKPRHKLHGLRGPWLEAYCKDGITRYYARQLRGEEIIRGSDRKGIKAKDLSAEAVWENELTSPRIEIPRVVIETMQFEIKSLSAQDVAIFWRLFAEARLQGLELETHTITVGALKAYLDIHERARIVGSLNKLSAARMSLHVNQAGAHGRVSMQIIEGFSADRDVITFALPSVLKNAALNARDYAWADINAIARFNSKFTTSLYLKLCLEAGKHFSMRSGVRDTREEFRVRVGLPETTKAGVLEDVLDRVRADILGISGCRRRFNVSFDDYEERMEITVGNVAKKLKELKPKAMTRAALQQVVVSNTVALAVPEARYPSLVRLRQAATLLNTSVLSVADMWRLDIHGATLYPEMHLVGVTGAEFLNLIDEYGPNEILEFWADKRDFSSYPIYRINRQTVDVGEAKIVTRTKTAAVIIEARHVEQEERADDDIRMGEDFGVLDYGDEPPHFEPVGQDWDDDDIPA